MAEAIVVRLFWMTSGAAPCQIGIVDSCKIERPNPNGTSSFEFRLPDGPWSFEGRLLGLAWAVEAIVFPTMQHATAIFTMSPSETLFAIYRTEEDK